MPAKLTLPIAPHLALEITSPGSTEFLAQRLAEALASVLPDIVDVRVVGQSVPATRDPGVGPNVPGGGA